MSEMAPENLSPEEHLHIVAQQLQPVVAMAIENQASIASQTWRRLSSNSRQLEAMNNSDYIDF